MKMNEMNRLNSEKMDEPFHAKIGHGMDIKIPIHPTPNGNAMMNGGPPTNIGNGGFINYGYNNYLDTLQTELHFCFDLSTINKYSRLSIRD